MDCYIVRIYRHVARNDGQARDIAGLVEEVGADNNKRSFTNFSGLVGLLKDSLHVEDSLNNAQPGLDKVIDIGTGTRRR